ncbi:hypothetical protein PMG11_03427 [Penicillium brasilianum]|uniref:Zn(2)-C6 fungal-type domain-containing protein n=1 Tax=Penicillium brasilianum TaxID=104259 RepID=A0A0F7VHD3_PENBI|nr:hypothetical protein PMG11_03427 [Penicillium brasilianum]
MRSTEAACLTCRQKSRRCDRGRPVCKRCISKGLQCGGYPDKFRFCGIASRGKWKGRDVPIDTEAVSPASSPSSTNVSRKIVLGQSDTSSSHSPNDALALVSQSSKSNHKSEIDRVLSLDETDLLLKHYDHVICPHQIAHENNSDNPYRRYVLPLAYEQIGLLYAVLGLSACHLGHLKSDKHLYETTAVDYRVKAITALGAAIRQVCSGSFNDNERDGVFVTIQILLLHDIRESGTSTHGAHISGALSICNQLKLDERLTVKDERTVFFLGNLIWLDIIRAFSVPERLCFTQELRQKLLSLCDLRFEAVNGCPRELALIIGEILEHAKAHSTDRLSTDEYHTHVQALIQKLFSWDSSRCFYPSEDPLWRCVAEAFRHTCILRAWRLLDPTESASTPRIQTSVMAILDSLAHVPGTNPLIELNVMPLFMAGADSLSPHSRHYVLLRLSEIQARAEMGWAAPQSLLEKVWQARARQSEHDQSNVPWMDFTHNADSMHQDDYLII